MLAASLVALASDGEAELGAQALARETVQGGMPPARVLHIMHLALLTVAAALAATAVAWWSYPAVGALIRVCLVTLLVWAVGDLAPRLLAALAPGLVPFARMVALRVAPVFAPLLHFAARVDPSDSVADGPAPRPGAQTRRRRWRSAYSRSRR